MSQDRISVFLFKAPNHCAKDPWTQTNKRTSLVSKNQELAIFSKPLISRLPFSRSACFFIPCAPLPPSPHSPMLLAWQLYRWLPAAWIFCASVNCSDVVHATLQWSEQMDYYSLLQDFATSILSNQLRFTANISDLRFTANISNLRTSMNMLNLWMANRQRGRKISDRI